MIIVELFPDKGSFVAIIYHDNDEMPLRGTPLI
jgi:hypothetical protein